MKPGLLLALLGWPALAMAWEEEPAIAFILAYNPVVQAQRHATAAYQPPGGLRRVMEHTSFYVRAAVRERLDFQHAKADWLQERVKKGYEGDIDKLWEAAQHQNTEAATVRRLELLIAAQRRHVAHHAGAQWQPLFQYLSGQRPQLPEG